MTLDSERFNVERAPAATPGPLAPLGEAAVPLGDRPRSRLWTLHGV